MRQRVACSLYFAGRRMLRTFAYGLLLIAAVLTFMSIAAAILPTT